MDWQRVNGRWVSDSFEIELVAPKKWVMRRTDSQQVSVSTEEEGESWEGPSLRRLKAVAEETARRPQSDSAIRRYLTTMWTAMFGVLAILQLSGPVAATAVIVLVGIFIWALVRAIDEIVYRPWDRISEQIQ